MSADARTQMDEAIENGDWSEIHVALARLLADLDAAERERDELRADRDRAWRALHSLDKDMG